MDYSDLKLFGKKVNLPDPKQVKIINIIDIFPGREGLKFIEVGANDGCYNDPVNAWVKKYHWKGVLIEPVPSAFKDLMGNYRGVPNIFFENVAICNNNNKPQSFYIPKSSKVASLNSKHPPMKKVKQVMIDTMTLNAVVEKYCFEDFNFLTIDAEGYDFNVLQSLDFNRYKPEIIHYEHRHLGESKEDCEEYLYSYGYKLYFNKNNTVALRKDIIG